MNMNTQTRLLYQGPNSNKIITIKAKIIQQKIMQVLDLMIKKGDGYSFRTFAAE